MRVDVTHKRLMQQNCIETLQSDQESLIQELSLLIIIITIINNNIIIINYSTFYQKKLIFTVTSASVMSVIHLLV